jgi:hypothetical protein
VFAARRISDRMPRTEDGAWASTLCALKGRWQKESVMKPVVLYYLYRLFRKGGCNAVKQWGLLE